jgi:predicted small lipoprotein YifL
MKTYCFYLIALSLIVLSACAQKRPVSMPQSHLPPESVPEIGGPVTDQGTVPDDSAIGRRGVEQNPLLSAVRPVQRPRPKALTRMIANAENQLKKRQPQLAFSILEQALYIDGQDPLVWHLMARSQLDQGNVVQAVSLAQKSNSLAAAYPDVKKKNAALLRQAQGWAD